MSQLSHLRVSSKKMTPAYQKMCPHTMDGLDSKVTIANSHMGSQKQGKIFLTPTVSWPHRLGQKCPLYQREVSGEIASVPLRACMELLSKWMPDCLSASPLPRCLSFKHHCKMAAGGIQITHWDWDPVRATQRLTQFSVRIGSLGTGTKQGQPLPLGLLVTEASRM